MISRDEILKKREIEFPLTEDMEKNLAELLICVNKLRDKYGQPMIISSGYRPGHYNTDVGGALNSPHRFCQAVDILDTDGKIKAWINSDILLECGLWMEHPDHTPTWVHVDIRPRLTRVFIP